jgi:hypothetical protein
MSDKGRVILSIRYILRFRSACTGICSTVSMAIYKRYTMLTMIVLCKLTRLAYPLQRRYGAKLEAHWASLVSHDPASLHACICVAATNSALESGEFPLTDEKKGSSVLLLDTFHHRGETIRLVNEGLSDPIKAASDELIAAVSVLLTVEVRHLQPLAELC